MEKLKGLMIAACASNSGKTVTSLALICALRSMGIPVIAAKSGPDYIDSSWLSWASGRPCANLDARMAQEGGLDILQKRMAAELKNGGIFIVEAAMGFYDGDRNGRYSAAELAARLKIPVILLLNARGVGHSLAAMAQGYLNYDAEWMGEDGRPRFLGFICTHTGGESHAQLCREILTPLLKKRGLDFFGCLSAKDAPVISSRHLGLRGPKECAVTRDELALFLKNAVSTDKILNGIQYIPGDRAQEIKKNTNRSRVFFRTINKWGKTRATVAIARDSAFSFCYADLPAMLKELGARIVFFSPLEDHSLPACDCVYLPGGYPELYADKLSANLLLLEALREAASRGKPIYGECGGFIYLGQSFKLIDGQEYEMCKLLPPRFELTSRLCALGYRELRPTGKNFFSGRLAVLHGHEFHYARISSRDTDTARLWKYRDSRGNEASDGFVNGSVMGAWSHLYPEGSRQFWQFFLSLCEKDK